MVYDQVNTVGLSTEQVAALNAIADELRHQYAKWGNQRHEPDKWYRILGEEVGEVARAINEHDADQYPRELADTAAVAANALATVLGL